MAGTAIGNVGTPRYGATAGAGINREDLLNIMKMIGVTKTPLINSVGRVPATAITHEWTVDTFGATNTNGALEGADFALESTTTPSRKANLCQIFRKDFGVTGTQIEVNSAGAPDIYAHELMKAMKEKMRDAEATFFTNQASASGTTTQARRMNTLETLITSVVKTQADTTAGATGDASHSGMMAAGDWLRTLKAIVDQGGEPECCMLNTSYKAQVSSFALAQSPGGSTTVGSQAMNQRNVDATSKTLIQSIQYIDTDFGVIAVILNQQSPQSANTTTGNVSGNTDLTGRVWFLDRSLISLAELRPMKHIPVGVRGDSVAGFIRWELTLQLLNELGCGYLKGVNNYSNLTTWV